MLQNSWINAGLEKDAQTLLPKASTTISGFCQAAIMPIFDFSKKTQFDCNPEKIEKNLKYHLKVFMF